MPLAFMQEEFLVSHFIIVGVGNLNGKNMFLFKRTLLTMGSDVIIFWYNLTLGLANGKMRDVSEPKYLVKIFMVILPSRLCSELSSREVSMELWNVITIRGRIRSDVP